MRHSIKRFFAVATIAMALPAAVLAGNPASVQSTARPYNLPVYGPVQVKASDSRAATFQQNFLPIFQQLINESLSESVVFNNVSGYKLDASRLYLRSTSDLPIRVYFVHEGAGYLNSLGFSFTPAGQATPGQPYLLFPNTSFVSPTSTTRNQTTPLVVGDFVELTAGGPGIQMDFFLVANGAQTPYNTWYNNTDLNVDDKQHVVAFLLPNSRYVMIGFEDLYNGGDLDYNDCLFVVDIGETNAANLFEDFSDLPN
jgi:Domain of unknown function (DUF4114)